jgi:TonB family protein
MAELALPLYRIYDLPWSTGREEEEKFRKILRNVGIATLILALILAVLPVPEPDPAAIEEVPRRLARLVLERQAPPPPPPAPVVEEEPVPEPEPVVEEPVVAEEPVPEPEPVREPEPVDRTQQARDRARVAGLLPFADQLATLRDNQATERLDRAEVVSPTEGAMPVAERSLITSRVGTASGGINTATLSRNTGGTGLTARTTTQVENPVVGIGDGGGEAVRSGVSDQPSRSREEIERVFDRNKGAIYALYNRALRENPSLEGKVVLRLTISSAGTVTACEIVSSELNDPDLEQKLVQRVMLFQFEPRDVAEITTTKPIDFFPA